MDRCFLYSCIYFFLPNFCWLTWLSPVSRKVLSHATWADRLNAFGTTRRMSRILSDDATWHWMAKMLAQDDQVGVFIGLYVCRLLCVSVFSSIYIYIYISFLFFVFLGVNRNSTKLLWQHYCFSIYRYSCIMPRILLEGKLACFFFQHCHIFELYSLGICAIRVRACRQLEGNVHGIVENATTVASRHGARVRSELPDQSRCPF